MRISLVSTFYPPYHFGGDAVSVRHWARALVHRGHDVTVVHDLDAYRTLHADPVPPVPDEDMEDGIRVIRLQSRWPTPSSLLVHQLGRPVAHARRLRQLLVDEAPDVVIFNNPSLIGGPAILAWPRRAVTVYIAHEHWLVCPTHVLFKDRKAPCETPSCLRCVLRHGRPPQAWRYTGALPRALAHVDRVLVLSEFSRQTHRALGVARPMDVLPNFVPDEALAIAADTDSPHPRPYFFFAGRLERLKGLDDVIPVFRDLPGCDLLIAGAGGHAMTLRRLATRLPNVRFLGPLAPAQLQPYYRHAVAALMPSIGFEAFPMVLLEAMQVGTPFVARALGPAPEIMAASGAGRLFDGPEELRAILGRLASDPVHRAELAARAKPAVRTHWAESVVVPRFLDMVLAEQARKRAVA